MSDISIQCQACLGFSSLPATYGNFNGPWRCPQCEAPHTVQTMMSQLMTMSAADAIPKPRGTFPRSVEVSLTEMVRSFNAGAPRAAAVMLRRALEAACIDKGARGGTLAAKIIDLGARLSVLDDFERHQASATRIFGNYGAHAADDGLDDMTGKDARRAIDLGVHLLERLYAARSSP